MIATAAATYLAIATGMTMSRMVKAFQERDEIADLFEQHGQVRPSTGEHLAVTTALAVLLGVAWPVSALVMASDWLREIMK